MSRPIALACKGCPAACQSPSFRSAPAAAALQQEEGPGQKQALHQLIECPELVPGSSPGRPGRPANRRSPDSCSQRCMMGVGHAALPLTVRRSCSRAGNEHNIWWPAHCSCGAPAGWPLSRCQAQQLGPHPLCCRLSLLLLRWRHGIVETQQLAVHGRHSHEHTHSIGSPLQINVGSQQARWPPAHGCHSNAANHRGTGSCLQTLPDIGGHELGNHLHTGACSMNKQCHAQVRRAMAWPWYARLAPT